jgi:peroxiredoxin
MPVFQAFYDQHQADGFTVIAISDGDATEAVISFVSEYKLTFPIWLDPESIATRAAFPTLNLPRSYVIDRGGTVRLRWVGGIDPAALEEYVAPLILE